MPPGKWRAAFSSVPFSKWAYSDSPLRVIADLDRKRGHFRVLYTSVYGGSELVAGNLGGGATGYAAAQKAAAEFMAEHPTGLAPPTEVTL